MDLDTARALAKQYVGHWRAFADLQEFLDFVAAQRGLHSELSQQITGKREELDALRGEEDGLRKKIEGYRNDMTRAREDAEIVKAQCAEAIARQKKHLEEETAAMRTKAEREYSESVKQHADRLEKIVSSVNKAQAELDRVNAALDEAKKKALSL